MRTDPNLRLFLSQTKYFFPDKSLSKKFNANIYKISSLNFQSHLDFKDGTKAFVIVSYFRHNKG